MRFGAYTLKYRELQKGMFLGDGAFLSSLCNFLLPDTPEEEAKAREPQSSLGSREEPMAGGSSSVFSMCLLSRVQAWNSRLATGQGGNGPILPMVWG